MGVRYVLEGSARKGDDQLRIIAQLIDATTGEHVWAEHYDRPLKEIFTVQDEIVQTIVTILKLQLTLLDQGYLVRKRTNNLETYDLYLRGTEFFWRGYNEAKKEANEQARQLFERAIELDPTYADAYGWLGGMYGTVFLAVEPNVSAGVPNVAGGSVVETVRLSPVNRPILGAQFAASVLSLINIGGIQFTDD